VRNNGTRAPFSGELSLREAVRRGINYNLGAVGLSQAVRQARGESAIARGALLPNLNRQLTEVVQLANLSALGVRIPIAPSIVGPFNYFDLRVRLSQTVADLTLRNNYRVATENVAPMNSSKRALRT